MDVHELDVEETEQLNGELDRSTYIKFPEI